jgi:mycothiol synthase
MAASHTRFLTCPPELYEEALGVLYQRVPESLRPQLIAEVLQEAARGQVDLRGLWIARPADWRLRLGPSPRREVVGALMTQVLAGRAVAVWAPEVLPGWGRTFTAAALVRAALADFRSRGMRLAQAVLDESANPHAASDLARGGMPRVTELLYLERDTRTPLIIKSPARGRAAAHARPASEPTSAVHPPVLAWRSYESTSQEEFRRCLQATYVASLDMPELDCVRTLDEILEGHRAAGRFTPRWWQLGQVPGEPAAAVVLLLAALPQRNAWEVVYLGLTPEARGRGLGHTAIAHALELARPHTSSLELAVDVRNHPALRLYESAGFSCFDRRSVHLVVFPGESTTR